MREKGGGSPLCRPRGRGSVARGVAPRVPSGSWPCQGLGLAGPRFLQVMLGLRTGADVGKTGANRTEFRYPSYVQHIMG